MEMHITHVINPAIDIHTECGIPFELIHVTRYALKAQVCATFAGL